MDGGSPALLEGVLQSIRAGVMSFAAVRGSDGAIQDFRWTYVNEFAEKMVGRSAADLIGADLTRIMPGNRAEGLFDRYLRIVETGEPADFEVDYDHDGLNASFAVRAVKHGDGFVVSFTDITAERQSRRQVERLSHRLDLATRAANLGVFDLDIASRVMICNGRMLEIYGLPQDGGGRLHYDQWLTLVHPDDLEGVERTIRNNIKSGIELNTRFRIRRADGSIRHVRAFATFVRVGGWTERAVGVNLDVTDEVRQLERVVRYKQAIEAATDGILFTGGADQDFAIEFVNRAFEKLTGYGADEVTGRNCRFLHGDEPNQPGLDRIRAGLSAGEPVTAEVRNYRKDGTPFWQELSITPLRDADDKVAGFLGIQHDISERVRQTRALERHADMLKTLGDIQASYITGQRELREVFDQILTAFLRAADAEYGFIGEVLTGPDGAPYLKAHAITNIAWDQASRAFFDLHDANGIEFHNMQTLFGHVMSSGDIVMTNLPASDPRAGGLPAGHPPLDAFLGLPLYAGSRLVGMVGLANRPSGFDQEIIGQLQPMVATAAGLIAAERVERQRCAAEAELILAKQRAEAANEAKGRFVAIMSHELRTPLNAIIGFAEMMREEVFGKLGDPHYVEYAGDILVSGRHLLGLINDILDLSRLDSVSVPLRPEAIAPAAVLEECVRSLDRALRERGLPVQLKLQDGIGKRVMDPRVLRQILLNLMSNAIKFSRPGRPIEISAKVDPRQFQLVVEDGGPGFQPEVLERVGTPFLQIDDPFRRDHGGAGLGLSIVKRLAELHGGSLTIANRPEGGARASVILPFQG